MVIVTFEYFYRLILLVYAIANLFKFSHCLFFFCNLYLDDERSSKEQDGLATLCISDVDTTLHYVNQWVQRFDFIFTSYYM